KTAGKQVIRRVPPFLLDHSESPPGLALNAANDAIQFASRVHARREDQYTAFGKQLVHAFGAQVLSKAEVKTLETEIEDRLRTQLNLDSLVLEMRALASKGLVITTAARLRLASDTLTKLA